jgi:hypothetical protein
VARTIGLSIYKDLKQRKKEGENSGAVRKGAFKQFTGHVLANRSRGCKWSVSTCNGSVTRKLVHKYRKLVRNGSVTRSAQVRSEVVYMRKIHLIHVTHTQTPGGQAIRKPVSPKFQIFCGNILCSLRRAAYSLNHWMTSSLFCAARLLSIGFHLIFLKFFFPFGPCSFIKSFNQVSEGRGFPSCSQRRAIALSIISNVHGKPISYCLFDVLKDCKLLYRCKDSIVATMGTSFNCAIDSTRQGAFVEAK